jgi:hypothetical protein
MSARCAPFPRPARWAQVGGFSRAARIRALALSPLLAAVVVLGLAGSARAGTYTVGDCLSASDHATVAGPWQFFGPSAGVTLRTECGRSPNAIFFAIPELPSTSMGFRASTAGTGLSIVAARLWWRAFGSASGEVEAEMEATTDEPEEKLAVSQAAGSGELVAHMTEPEELRFPASDGVTTIDLAEHCYPGDKCPMTESSDIGIELFGSELTVNDETPPTISITGVKDAGGFGTAGPMQASFTATDGDAGIKKAELLLDGTPVATHEYGSSCSYTHLTPCPASISDSLESPVMSLLEAGHQLSVRVTDAAENVTVAPVPPVANGVPCEHPTIALTADARANAVTIPYGKRAIVEGRVGCGPTPVPDASIALVTATAFGARPSLVTTVQSGSAGTFRYQLPRGPSRTVTAAYRAYSNEPAATTQAAVTVKVKPKITLHIRPRRTHNGGTITWRGWIRGGPYPVAGMPLLVQVKEGRRWQTFDEFTLHGAKIAYRYTFHRTIKPATYTFRVALPRPGAAGYPYTAGASRKVSVRVR